jgi:phytoene/squalene synthetase
VLALIIAVFAVVFSHYQLAAVKRESARRLAELQQVSAATRDRRADAEARGAPAGRVAESRLAKS